MLFGLWYVGCGVWGLLPSLYVRNFYTQYKSSQLKYKLARTVCFVVMLLLFTLLERGAQVSRQTFEEDWASIYSFHSNET